MTKDVFPHDRASLKDWLVRKDYPENSQTLVMSWLDRGDRVVGYQCLALDSPALGRMVLISAGSAWAQIRLEEGSEPPERLPVSIPLAWSYRFKFQVSGVDRG
jgi:hypothetical protein